MSRVVTEIPAAHNARTRAEPTKPDAPVTSADELAATVNGASERRERTRVPPPSVRTRICVCYPPVEPRWTSHSRVNDIRKHSLNVLDGPRSDGTRDRILTSTLSGTLPADEVRLALNHQW